MESPSEQSPKADREISESLRLETGSLRFLVDVDWWRRSVAIAFRFAPYCLVCGLGIAVLNIAVVVGTFFLEQKLRTFTLINDATMPVFLTTIGIALVSILAILVGTFLLLGLWLMRLTAFARAWLESGGRASKEDFDQSITDTGRRKKLLGAIWFFASLYLIPALLPLCILIALKMLTGPEYSVNGEPLVPLPVSFNAPAVHTGAVIAIGCLSIVVLSYSLVITVISSVSASTPFRTATQALTMCFRNAGALLVVSVVVFLLNLAISAPYMVLFFTNLPVLMKENIWLSSIAQAWMGVSSLILWPLSLAPICEVTRSGAVSGATNVE